MRYARIIERIGMPIQTVFVVKSKCFAQRLAEPPRRPHRSLAPPSRSSRPGWCGMRAPSGVPHGGVMVHPL